MYFIRGTTQLKRDHVDEKEQIDGKLNPHSLRLPLHVEIVHLTDQKGQIVTFLVMKTTRTEHEIPPRCVLIDNFDVTWSRITPNAKRRNTTGAYVIAGGFPVDSTFVSQRQALNS